MSFHQILKQIKAKRVLVLGDIMVDEYIQGECSRISPEAPVPILEVKSTFSVPGGAANTASNIASLGAKVYLIGFIGKDLPGTELVSQLKKFKVDFYPIYDKSPTVRKTRVLGDRQQIVRIDFESPRITNDLIVKQVLQKYLKLLSKSDFVVISDYAKGFVTKILSQSIISHAKAKNIPVLIDPRPINSNFYKGCDYITPNWKEAHEILNFKWSKPSPKNIHYIASALKKKLNTTVLLTLGSGGLYCLPRNSSSGISLPVTAREVFDVSGAGDTVVAAFSVALSIQSPLEQALSFANKAAGVVVGKLGTSRVSPNEIVPEIQSKLLYPKQLANWAKIQKNNGLKIVTINGSFDVLHAGHAHILNQAKQQGDILLVGLNSDKSVKKYKGEKRPIINETARAEMLLALSSVDYVYIFNEATPIPFLKIVQPHIHVNGSEYGKNCIEAPTVIKGGGRIHIVDLIDGCSTSELIRKIKTV